jgi:hypothetical protein
MDSTGEGNSTKKSKKEDKETELQYQELGKNTSSNSVNVVNLDCDPNVEGENNVDQVEKNVSRNEDRSITELVRANENMLQENNCKELQIRQRTPNQLRSQLNPVSNVNRNGALPGYQTMLSLTSLVNRSRNPNSSNNGSRSNLNVTANGVDLNETGTELIDQDFVFCRPPEQTSQPDRCGVQDLLPSAYARDIENDKSISLGGTLHFILVRRQKNTLEWELFDGDTTTEVMNKVQIMPWTGLVYGARCLSL